MTVATMARDVIALRVKLIRRRDYEELQVVDNFVGCVRHRISQRDRELLDNAIALTPMRGAAR